jgi:hypothetical protein
MPLPKSSTMMLRHEPTLIATTGYQLTASSPRGTFSQAELTADRVITDRYHVCGRPGAWAGDGTTVPTIVWTGGASRA